MSSEVILYKNKCVFHAFEIVILQVDMYPFYRMQEFLRCVFFLLNLLLFKNCFY